MWSVAKGYEQRLDLFRLPTHSTLQCTLHGHNSMIELIGQNNNMTGRAGAPISVRCALRVHHGGACSDNSYCAHAILCRVLCVMRGVLCAARSVICEYNIIIMHSNSAYNVIVVVQQLLFCHCTSVD